MATATEALRAATRDLHARIETTPFAKSLLDKSIHPDAYVGYIRVMAVIHAALESRLDACDHPLVSQVWSEDLRRLPELLEDNDAFRWKLAPEAPKAAQAALRAASHILLMSKDNPVALLGGLYVLGGSTKGAVILAPLAMEALGLSPGHGLSYLSRHSGQGPAKWERAAAALDDCVTDSEQVKAMGATARVVFQCLLEAFEALWPLDRAAMQYVAAAFNPEAGDHPVPQDRRDLIAVLRASERCLAEFPYFIYRFGQRGRRFADTDGAWLATLPELGTEAMQAQVDWLGQVLSARGMPRILLARHMEILAQELLAAGTGQPERSSMLDAAAKKIRGEIDARLSRERRREHERNFQQACGRLSDFACAEAITLLVSAVVDEADCLEGSIASLLSWLVDPNRFPRVWVEAIHEHLAAIRQELSVKAVK
ncbi:MAG: biliverdin-producing heme oxygenase [Desulfovibrionaceae bacterium]|nr:biliverdin-producing heme oxygenase [Desulfovibrionaceae bacterium]MBF0513676.1 biliverdin-producing heme oxygenase [Desulfovibrionaceae bacterium]